MNVYGFSVKAQDGSDVALEKYRGKLLLIVNTATGCMFTPQYDELEALYIAYKDRGFEILDFPCNQFGGQAPGNDGEIYSFCTGRYGITFPQFSKIDVNGENAIPLFRWLTENTTFEGFGASPLGVKLSDVVRKAEKDFKKNGNIKWNFTKFLISRDGEIAARFEPTEMKELKRKIEEFL